MKIFLTGATGFIGSAIVPELVQAGHQVLGLTRSEDGAKVLTGAGAQVHRGSLENLDSLRSGAGQSDGVIHCAFNNDMSNFAASTEQESRAIDALTRELMNSDRPLVITSVAGLGIASPGQLATEDYFDADSPNPRKSTEIAWAAVANRGVNVSVVRLPQVHNTMKLGIPSLLIKVAVFDKVPRSKLAIPGLALKFLGKTSVFLYTEAQGNRAHRGKVLILVNEHTTGAAEMLAQFAQENGLATILGTKTPGRLVSRSATKLGDGYRLVVPVAAYVSAKGKQIEGNGITPDVEVPWSFADAVAGVDNQLAAALKQFN